MGQELTPEAQATRAIMSHELWATCEHLSATARSHRCPDCRGTLRRCCNSLIGREHAETCQATSRHEEDGAA